MTEHELRSALGTLCLAHTRTHWQVGFTVETSAYMGLMFTNSEYVEAWAKVRKFMGMPTEPVHEDKG